MSEHTPGPWKLKRERSGDEYGAVIGADGELVATTGYRVRVGSNEDDANARLIARAPAMFELLTRVADGYEITMAEAAAVVRANK